jgi:hypothetical protein
MTAKEAYITVYKNRSLIGNVEIESIIANSYIYSYYYAQNILKGRFELGEFAISNYMLYLYYYLTVVPNTFSIDLVSKILVSKYKADFIWWYFRALT